MLSARIGSGPIGAEVAELAAQRQFPELEDPKLFLASPGDVAYLRRMAQQVVDSLDGTGGGANALAMFAWETDLAETPFDDGTPIQEQIYRPDDPLCQGLVAFFGEKIGQPLAADFPTDMLRDLLAAFDGAAFRPVHPWTEDAADSGGFPLTGSTFEVLCAIAANRRRQTAENQPKLPIFLAFASPPDVLDTEDAENGDWGNRRLRDLVSEKFKKDRKTRQHHENVIADQLSQLRNFVLFLKDLGLEPQFEPDEEKIEQSFRKWLAANFLLVRDPLKTDPFRGLRSYDVDDYHVYFGRSEDQKRALRRIEAILEDTDCHNFLWIMGSSGAGKSSFLRAGVVGALRYSPRSQADYVQTIHRPNTLLSKAAAMAVHAHCPLRVLLANALEALAEAQRCTAFTFEKSEPILAAFDRLEPSSRPGWAADTLEAILAEDDAGSPAARPTRLVIGIDQFEEIVDMLDDPELGPKWALFAEFLTLAPLRPHVLVLATLREERVEKMQRHGTLKGLWERSSAQKSLLSFPSATELESIIRKPFSEFGRAVLEDALVERLVSAIMTFARRHTMESAGSILPLVSLCLQRISENVADPLIEARHAQQDQDPRDALNIAASAPTPTRPATGPVAITVEDAEGFTELEGVIADLAARAMDEARDQKALEAGETTVDGLLRQLVRWSGGDDKQFYLPTVRLTDNSSEQALARALVKHRLLVDEGAGQVRLVHETVLEHWPEGRDFCLRERPLHESAGALGVLADMWVRPNPGPSILDAGLENHADAAFQILALWAIRLHEYHCAAPDPKDLKLRSYCLALLDATCDPRRVVEGSPQKSTHLHLAALYGRCETVRKMLDTVPDAVALERADGRTAVFAPCFSGDVALFDLLVERGAQVDHVETAGWRPIHAAAVGGSVALTKRLLDEGADPGAGGAPNGIAPLHLAARHGNTDLITYLIDEVGLDPNMPDTTGKTPAMHAMIEDRPDMLHHLVAKGADLSLPVDKSETSIGMTAIHLAARDGHVRSLEALLDLGLSADLPTINGGLALHLAAHNGFPACIRVLTRRMENPDVPALNSWTRKDVDQAQDRIAAGKPDRTTKEKSNWTALHFAAAAGHLKAVQALLDSEAEVNARTLAGDTPLHLAIAEGRDQVAILLSGRGADLDARNGSGETPLQQALAKARHALAADLIRQHASIETPVHSHGMTDRHAATLLHVAAARKDDTLLRFVLNHQADVSRKTAFGRTALHIAAASGLDRNVALILDRGGAGAIFERDVEGLTPVDSACLAGSEGCFEAMAARTEPGTLRERCPHALHLAAQGGRSRLVEKLVEMGYDPKAYDQEGFTPLHVAARHGRDRAAEALLRRGARALLPLVDDPDVTAFDLALESGHVAVLKRLLESREAHAIDPAEKAFHAVRIMQFDCAAALLEHLDEGDLRHPASGVMLSALYRAALADLRERLPQEDFASEALEAILPEPEKPAARTRKAAPADSAAPRSEKTSASGKAPEFDPTGVNRSAAYPVAADLYPEYDTGSRKLWTSVLPDGLSGLIDQITPIDGKHRLDPQTCRGAWRPLPWYENAALIQLADPSLPDPSLRFYYLTMDGNIFRLNGTSPPIHEVNAKAPIRLTESNVVEYLRFFCFFVRGEEGPFYICESADDPLIPKHPQTETLVNATVRPATCTGRDANGSFLCDGVIYYSNAIFIADFAVQPTGMIEMLNDEPVAADLPVKINAPVA